MKALQNKSIFVRLPQPNHVWVAKLLKKFCESIEPAGFPILEYFKLVIRWWIVPGEDIFNISRLMEMGYCRIERGFRPWWTIPCKASHAAGNNRFHRYIASQHDTKGTLINML